ncbi:GNAT family N-acetyltransferase [Geomicrobium sp. JCM 19039]|uniref:GNAT family N-acetyltransferase n=1 Tax=Geomicrobium sp. JCM 19039 TaxID=1460636 RepID=UPI00045F4C39|nr:GNAT family N-acetyltransferase [Geomicrobium sp. JCM 19039]GAK12440.1 acetyltransferase [Geomicrobium sp. JCM 19039]
MIRRASHQDIDAIINIWHEGSILAHSFIRPDYWNSQIDEMKTTYIPMSVTHVKVENMKIVGFISMVDNYLAALFVDQSYRNSGIGKELLECGKKQSEHMKVKVYKKNTKAVHFYERNGFIKVGTLLDENTNEQECLFEWNERHD